MRRLRSPLARLGTLAMLMMLAGACAPQLRPAPDATLVATGHGQGAAAEAGGVRVVARAGAWRAWPTILDSVVTPVLVTIENATDVPLRVRYADFALVSAQGPRFAARAPFEIDGFVSQPAWGQYPYGPYLRPYPRFYAYRDAAGRPVLIDPFLYDPFFDLYSFVGVPLPTADMVQLALPERVLEPHGRTAGFVYFERVHKVSRVDFTVRLVDDRSGAPHATVTIPFVLQ
jgi:hypothetical protein